MSIKVAFQGRTAIASILTLRHKETLTYKYGCSDESFNALGGTHFLFWKSIQEAKAEGLLQFDLGRSELDNPGLITFKDRWGTDQLPLTYWRYSQTPREYSDYQVASANWLQRFAKATFVHLPDPLLVAIGKVLYRHIG